MPESYLIQCFNCLSEFDAAEAIWCSCNPQRPTKVCPFCMGCFCAAGEPFKETFWRDAPASLRGEIETLSESRMLIGEMLVRSGIISTSQLLEALNRQKIDGRRLGEILVDIGALPSDRLDAFLQSQHTVTSIDVTRARVDASMIRKLGVDQCLEQRILPLEAEAFRDRHIMTLAMADPSNTAAVERVMQATGYQVIPGVASGEAIIAVIRSIFPPGSATTRTSDTPASASAEPDSACARVLAWAVERRASHIEIHEHEGRPRTFYRIDGTLYLDRARGGAEPAEVRDEIIRMVGLDREAKPGPRVGRARVGIDGMEYQVLVRTKPGRHGDELCVKVLDPISFPPHLDDLGLPEAALERLRMALDRQTGLVVISAPPMSGASSTFYALVMEMMAQGRSLALVESPRAVNLTDVIQEEFFPEISGSLTESLTRATGSGASVLAITASDGFIWSAEAANLPERMLVICRIESRSLPDALLRLVANGYPAAALGLRPTLILHQRLVRRICQACRTQDAQAGENAAALKLNPEEAEDLLLWRGTGCDDCGPSPGFRGRLPLAQTLRTDVAVAAAVARGSASALLGACRAAGMSSMRREALAALSAGLTTPGEISPKTPA